MELGKKITETLDRIETYVRIGSKQVLTLEEACLYTGYSRGHLYRLTSENMIPHSKQGRTLFFDKDELNRWLTRDKVATEADIDSRAATYLATRKQDR